MEYKRADRVGDLIRSELAEIIQRKIKDPRIGFVTITRVEMSDDLKSGRVYISTLGNQEELADSLKGLESAFGFIKAELGRRLELRYIPKITFMSDDSYEEGEKVLKLLRELKLKDEEEV
jgi:ribosome-binding factor A